MSTPRPFLLWSTWHRVALALADDGAGWIPSLMPDNVTAAMSDLVATGIVARIGVGDLFRLTDAARLTRQTYIDSYAAQLAAGGDEADARDSDAQKLWWHAAAHVYGLCRTNQSTLADLYAVMDRANQDWSVSNQGPGMAGASLRGVQ